MGAKKGVPLSEEHKAAISRSKIGHSVSIKTRMKISKKLRNMGFIPPKETRFKKGEKHPKWKGGITPKQKRLKNTREYKIWRRAVYEKDNYKCVWCGSEEKLNTDHIKPFCDYPELRYAIDNGRILCEECHKTTESYGRWSKKRRGY